MRTTDGSGFLLLIMTLFVVAMLTASCGDNDDDYSADDDDDTTDDDDSAENEDDDDDDDDDEISDERGGLISSEYIRTIKVDDVVRFFPEKDEIEGDITPLPKYDIDIYRIKYYSTFQGNLVELSGLVVVPDKQGPLSHLQYHHGTMFPYPHPNGEGNLDAPSLYDGKGPSATYRQYETRLFGNFLGSYGYLVSLPDYLGYGASSSKEHPYLVNDRLAEQSVDMILATRAFCKHREIELDGKLFMSGWSEGGSVSLAVQKLIESSYRDEISITANAPLAGFFNLRFYSRLMFTFLPFFTSDWGNNLDVILWMIYAVNQYIDDSPLNNDALFKFKVENQFDVLKDRPTSRPAEAIYFPKDEEREIILSKFDKNDLAHGWTPIAPVYVHHGTMDLDVPYLFNAETTVNNLNDLGGHLILRKYKGHDHESLAQLYLLNMVDDFDQYL